MMWAKRALLVGLAALVGCGSIPEGRFECSSASQCPSGWYCRDGHCYSQPADAGADAGGPPRPCDAPADCDDGDSCNGTEECSGGSCRPGTPVVCDDSDPCTLDTCNPGDGSCTYPAVPCAGNQHCESGACVCDTGYGDCDMSPATGCESDFANDEANCGGCSRPCLSAESCIGGSCGSCTGDAECSDTLPCTTDSCVTGRCENVFSGVGCMIDGACYAMDDPRPGLPCQACLPGTSQTSWSNRSGTCGAVSMSDGPCGGFATVCATAGTLTRTTTTPTCVSGACNPVTSMSSVACTRPSTDGASCDDGVFCNGLGMCSGGTCTPGPIPCVGEVCDESGDRCINCGGLGERCCPGRGVDDSRDLCCGPDPGTVQECCTNSDCDPANFCGGGTRWECIGGGCCFGPCDGAC